MSSICGCGFKVKYDKKGNIKNRKELIKHTIDDNCMWCGNSYLGW